jgi:fatty-acyl-CoA synthase
VSAVQPPLLPRLHDYVTHYAGCRPAAEAVVHDDVRMTWTDLSREVDACARALLGLGVARGDRVAMLSDPCSDFLVVYLATVSIGGIFQGLNPKYTRGELAHVAVDAQPVLLFGRLGAEGSEDRTATLATEVTSVRATIDWADGGYDRFLAYGTGVGQAALDRARAAVEPLDPAVLVHTSGSTGRPKGALLPHRGLTFCSTVQADHWVQEPGERFICNLPINHVGCLGDTCAATVVAGGTLVFQERFDPEAVLALIERERINLWGAVPAMFAMSVRSPGFERADLSSLRRIVWSGGAMPLPLARRLAERCGRCSNAYGMTETVGSVTYTADDDDLEVVCTTIGRPDPRYEVRIARADGSTCGIDEEGEVVVRGDFVMRGYLDRPEATAEALDSDGWLHTGDVAKQRSDGNYVLVGRLKEMYKSGGYNVCPREIEVVLEEHPDVSLAAVIGVHDETFGEVGHAFVLDESGRLDAQQLRDHARAHLANYKVPKQFTIATSLPMLPIGKIDKLALRSRSDP